MLFPFLELHKYSLNQLDYSNINNLWITNPDSNDDIWLIKNNNKLYIVPYLFKISHITNNQAFEVIKKNNKYIVLNKIENINNLNYYKLFKNNTNIAHPNETYVDEFLQKLI